MSDDKVVPMFSDHDVIKAAKAEVERMSRHEREEQRKIASTIPESKLPCPRLELRWNKGEYEKRCDYNFVLPITQGDIRSGAAVQFGPELRFCMGWTTNSGGDVDHPRYPNGVINVPFRDGAHAAWDSHNTGFPAFVIWQGQAQSILPVEPTGDPVEDPDDEHSRGDAEWAHRAATHVLEEAQKVIRRTAFKVRDLRDEQRERSWPWLYFNKMYDDLMEQADSIENRSFTDFADWVRFQADDIKIGMEKRVCGECGKEIPNDLTQACEHIFGEDARLFLAE
ncbi:MAG: hypothetical protein JRG69_11200 [Deltaproteobacteria bacterium]|nr:hypothetical protein [Deltaproteobacteria bacterium]